MDTSLRNALLALACLAAPLAVCPAQDNLVPDGDFEMPPKLATSAQVTWVSGGWFLAYNKCDPAQAKVFLDKAQKHGGTDSVSVQGATPAGGSAGVAREFAARAGESYEVSFWYRTALTKGNAALSVTHLKEKHRVELPASSEWKPYTHRFKVEFSDPAKTEASISVRFLLFNAETAGQVWFDDVVLKKVP
jgi:hypothetical protein